MTEVQGNSKFTGFASNALLQRQIGDVLDEARNHDIYNMRYVWPALRLLFSTVYYFVKTELPKDDEEKDAFLSMVAEYEGMPVFRFTPAEANHVMDAIFFILHAKGLLGFKPVMIEKVLWSWETLKATDKMLR